MFPVPTHLAVDDIFSKFAQTFTGGVVHPTESVGFLQRSPTPTRRRCIDFADMRIAVRRSDGFDRLWFEAEFARIQMLANGFVAELASVQAWFISEFLSIEHL